MEPLISIIVPVYNVENYLVACVDSILSQCDTNIEVLLIDDGSTDKSGEICDIFAQKDKRVRAWHIENGGVSRARNYGMKHICGEYFMFVDSDDELSRNALVELRKAMSREQNADVIIYGTCVIRDDGRYSATPEEGKYSRAEFGQIYINLYQKFLINSPCNKLYRASLLDDTTVFPAEMSLGEDLIFCNSYLRKCVTFCLLDQALYIYKQRKRESLTTKYYSRLFELYYTHYLDVVHTICQLGGHCEGVVQEVLYKMYFKYIKQAIGMISRNENSATWHEKYAEIRSICKHPFTIQCVKSNHPRSAYEFLIKKRNPLCIASYLLLSKLVHRSGA